MIINYSNHTIELTSTEWNEAKNNTTQFYKELQQVKRENRGYDVVKVKTKKTRSIFAKLTATSIKNYVELNGTDEQKAAYKKLTTKTIDSLGLIHEAATFMEVKSWFMNEFPQIKDALVAHQKEIEDILKEAEEKAEQRKMTRMVSMQRKANLSVVE